MEAICCSGTTVDFNRTVWHYIPEESSLHSHRCENFKSNRYDVNNRHIFPLKFHRALLVFSNRGRRRESIFNALSPAIPWLDKPPLRAVGEIAEFPGEAALERSRPFHYAENICSMNIPCWFLAWVIHRPWRWWRHDHPKLQLA
jgi:hypothetical protein